MTTNMHTVRRWIEAGCDPADENAPSIDELRDLERDDLIARIETMGAMHPRWLLTTTGFYEADRQQHRDARIRRGGVTGGITLGADRPPRETYLGPA